MKGTEPPRHSAQSHSGRGAWMRLRSRGMGRLYEEFTAPVRRRCFRLSYCSVFDARKIYASPHMRSENEAISPKDGLASASTVSLVHHSHGTT